MARTLLAHAEKLLALQRLVETGSFRRTAALLGVTPSALSQAISALEGHLGRTLVVRARGRASATPFAEELLASVGPALSAILAVEKPAAAALPRTKLRLGAYESIAVYALPTLLARLGAGYPALSLSIRTGRSGNLATLVRRGELDAALVVENELVGRLDVEVLAHDELGLYASPHDPALRGATRDLAYAGLAPGADGLPRYYRAVVRAYGLGAVPLVSCDSFEALRIFAARQVAAAILPRRVAMRAPGELRLVPPPRGAPDGVGRHAICLVSRRGVSPALRDLLARELRAALAPTAP